MPPKRRTTKRKAAATPAAAPEPVVEPVVEVTEQTTAEPEVITPEPVVEESTTVDQNTEDQNDEEEADDVENNDEQDSKKPKKEPLTIEEKIALLDKLSKAHPFGLIMNLAKLSNHSRPWFTITHNTKPEDHPADQAFEKSMSVICRYGENKITVPKIPGDNFRFAKKIGADLILKHLYGEDHEIEPETSSIIDSNGSEIIYDTDAEWYNERKEQHSKNTTNRIDKIVAKINANDKLDDETKKQRIEKYESFKVTNEELLAYDDIYKSFDHPYYKVLNNAIFLNKSIKYETKLFKFEGENEIEIAVPKKGGKKRKNDEKSTENAEEENAEKPSEAEVVAEEENSSEEKLTKFKVCIKVLKNNECILELEHVDDTTKLKEAKSEAAYKVLEKLLTDGILKQVNRSHLKSSDSRINSRFGNRYGNNRGGNFRGRGRGGMRGRGMNRNSNFRGGNRNNSQNNQKKNNQNNRNQQNQNNQNQQVQQQNMMQQQQQMMGGMMGGQMGGQQMMMMPVMMGPNGQMMIASNAQPMMMNMPQQMNAMSMNSNNQTMPNKPKRGKSRGRGRGAKRVKKE